MRALIYRRGGLGDTLLLFPTFELLKRKGYEVVAVGNTDYLKIAHEVGWVDAVLSETIDIDADLRISIGVGGNVPPFPKNREWIVKHYLRSVGLEGDFSRVLPLSPCENSPFARKVVFHPSSGSWKKNPDIGLFLELEDFVRSRGFEVAYLCGEADGWVKEHIRDAVESLDPLWIGKALTSAILYVGLDSGISHLAAYVGVPTVVIYGPTDPLVWKPIGREVYQVSLGLDCAPCFPEVCGERVCLERSSLLKRLLPLIDELLIKINEDNSLQTRRSKTSYL
ncbi:MAG TPA: lipopolysaccharide heptosyltransferase family protein [Aquifex aeolicus]|nr:lipopolysaccharide heptosyltransferase family protein [Aquifex aeolicus]